MSKVPKVPKGEMDYEQWVEAVLKPDFGDSMVFQLTKVRPDSGTFSREAVESVVSQMRAFVMGRIFSRMKQGDDPTKLHIKVSLAFDNDPLIEYGTPWWAAGDEGEGMNVMEGKRREHES